MTRTVCAVNARGRYIAVEHLHAAGPKANCWVEDYRQYEDEMLVPYPTWICLGVDYSIEDNGSKDLLKITKE